MLKSFFAALIAAFTITSAAFAAEGKGSADEAVAMVERAISLVEANGIDAAMAAFMDPNNTEFHDRDLYVFVINFEGVELANGANPKFAGSNLYDLKDVNGVYLVREMINVARDQGTGWVDYNWTNPTTKKIDSKSSYVKRIDGDMLVAVGIYK